MSFLKRVIKDSIRNGISDAIGNAVENAVEKKVAPAAQKVVDKAVTPVVNKATESINQAADNMNQTMDSVNQAAGQARGTSSPQATTGLAGAFAGFQSAMMNMANQAAMNMKVCPKCNTPTMADKKFCPQCGEALPEETVAQGAVCPSCGKQNSLDTRFCQDCGAKLPVTIAEEQKAAEQDATVMLEWEQKLSAFPKWSCGGKQYNLEQYDGVYVFTVGFDGDHEAAKQAVEQYRQTALENGFKQAGQYPSEEHLYKMVNGTCYHVDTEHCFEGDLDRPSIGLGTGEPTGGFHYVKPEPKKKGSWKDLFGL